MRGQRPKAGSGMTEMPAVIQQKYPPSSNAERIQKHRVERSGKGFPWGDVGCPRTSVCCVLQYQKQETSKEETAGSEQNTLGI